MKLIKTVSYSCFMLLFSTGILTSCNSGADKGNADVKNDSLSEAQKHLPENALKSLTIADGLG